MSNIHAAASTLVHLHQYGSGSSGSWGSRIFGWVVQAAIWHIVGSIFREFPILGTIGMIALVGGGIWFAVRWISRRRMRRASPSRSGWRS